MERQGEGTIMSFLNFHHLTKSFEGDLVIKDLSLSIREGEFVTFLGPSGSGKSTLFHLLGGILLPDDGEIDLNNHNITGKKGSISYMPQSPSLLPWRTILDNVVLGQELKGQKDLNLAKEMLKKAGLSSYDKAYPDELSGGMKQRASFIRALLSPEPLLCLDEPFSALDELTRLEMQKWLLSIWDEDHRTVLFITHNIEEAIFMSDRVFVLSNKPTTIKAEFNIPFTRPRSEELFMQEEFFQWKKKIYYSLKSKGE